MPEVIQLEDQQCVEERLLELESQISELKSPLLFNESANFYKNTKEAQNQWARGDSNARSPTCEGDVITN